VPVDSLIDYIEAGDTLDEFLDNFPSVSRAAAIAALEEAKALLTSPRWRYATHLEGHDCRTVVECGWSGKKNGELLVLADPLFDVLLTLDKNLPYQQDLNSVRIAVQIVRAHSNRIQDLLPLLPECRAADADDLSRLNGVQGASPPRWIGPAVSILQFTETLTRTPVPVRLGAMLTGVRRCGGLGGPLSRRFRDSPAAAESKRDSDGNGYPLEKWFRNGAPSTVI
jgi:uncharacterized protein DUF433